MASYPTLEASDRLWGKLGRTRLRRLTRGVRSDRSRKARNHAGRSIKRTLQRRAPRLQSVSGCLEEPTHCPHQPQLRFPLPWPPSMRTLVLCPKGPTTRVPATCRTSETGLRLSARPGFVEERRGPPRLRDRPLRACSGRTPRRIPPPPCPMCAGGRYGLR